MALTHYVTTRFTVTAGNSSGADITSQRDDNSQRRVKGLFCSDTTANVVTELVQAGAVVARFAHSAFSAANGPLPVDATYDVGQEIHVNCINSSGGSVTPEYTIQYEVDR